MRILRFDSVDSTQSIASQLLSNCLDDVLIIANTQTHGKGRLNERTWISSHGNFHGSFIVNIKNLGLQQNSASMLNMISLTIIKNFIEFTANQVATIKHPNDVLIDGLKIAGVLVEVHFPKAIIGVGLNTAVAPIKTSIKLDLDNTMFADFFYKKLYENSSTY